MPSLIGACFRSSATNVRDQPSTGRRSKSSWRVCSATIKVRCVKRSWRVPAGESPARVRGSVPLGSECCGVEGDDHGEAYTAIMWGVGVSHESDKIAGAQTFSSVEGNTCCRDARHRRPAGV